MKIKNVNLEWYVFYKDFNSKKIVRYNVLGGSFAEEVAKNIKKRKISNKDDLREYLKRDFMYHYWSRSEFEVAVGGVYNKYPEEFEKIDIWYQLEPNLDRIVDYIITEMKIIFKEEL